jgi:hypothetical protein
MTSLAKSTLVVSLSALRDGLCSRSSTELSSHSSVQAEFLSHFSRVADGASYRCLFWPNLGRIVPSIDAFERSGMGA